MFPARLLYFRRRYCSFGVAWEIGWVWPNGIRYEGTNSTLDDALAQAGRALEAGEWGERSML